MSEEKKKAATPLPITDVETEAYWKAAKEGYLAIPVCKDTGKAFFYPRRYSPFTWSENVEYTRASGRGTIYTYTVAHRHPNPAFNAQVPYVVALIELEEGPRMMSRVLNDPKEVKIGAKVEVVFEELSDEISLPCFKLAE